MSRKETAKLLAEDLRHDDHWEAFLEFYKTRFPAANMEQLFADGEAAQSFKDSMQAHYDLEP